MQNLLKGKFFKLPEHKKGMVAVIHIIPHIALDFTPYSWPVIVFALIYQAVFIPAFSLPTSDPVLSTSRERRPAIQTLHFINQDRLKLPALYQCFFHILKKEGGAENK